MALTYAIDYQEMFAPVAKLSSVWVLLSLAVHFSWDLHQLDVKKSFLNGDLTEEVYMQPPLGYMADGKVCELKKNTVWSC